MTRVKIFAILIFSVLSILMLFVSASAAEEAESILTVENYTVYIDDADDIVYLRYAKGDYTTSAEIKNASDCITVGQAKLQAATENGTLAYEMPDGGIYSIWIKLSDGRQQVFPSVDITNMTREVYVEGVNVTLKNTYGISDFFIAKGSFTSYSEIKTNGFVVRVSSLKLDGKKSYTYPLTEEGDYTILVRSEGEEWYEHFTVDCENPTFSANGLQLTVGNLNGVKCIRTAYGQFSTIALMKKSDTHRGFTAKEVIKDREEYTIQYRENGTVTVAVQYLNGYTEFFEYNVEKKLSEMTQNGSMVTFTGLEDLVMIRYARGSYTTAWQIKNANGSKYLKGDSIVNDAVTLMLEAGEYSFYTQYDDDSYNFYNLTVDTKGEFTKNYSYTNSDGSIADKMNYWLYTPENATENMPLIVVLHCAYVKEKSELTDEENLEYMVSSSYDDVSKYFYNGSFGDVPAYIVMPQIGNESRGWGKKADEVAELVGHCTRTYKIDPDNISIIGFSIGGTGAVEVAAAYPEIFSRVLSVAGGLDGVTNNTRPFIDGARFDISKDYPELQVMNVDGTKYESETMLCQYTESVRYKATTEAQIAQAEAFKDMRVADTAAKLAGIELWNIAGGLDHDVEPVALRELCGLMGENASRTYLEDCSHNGTLKACLDMASEIKAFLLG